MFVNAYTARQVERVAVITDVHGNLHALEAEGADGDPRAAFANIELTDGKAAVDIDRVEYETTPNSCCWRRERG
jgi:hypothetical protein